MFTKANMLSATCCQQHNHYQHAESNFEKLIKANKIECSSGAAGDGQYSILSILCVFCCAKTASIKNN